MEEITKSLKWYFSHLRLWVVLVFWVGLNLATIGPSFPDLAFNIGFFIFVLIAPLYGITQSRMCDEQKKIDDDEKIQYEKYKKKKQKEDAVEYLSTISYSDRLDLIDEVQKKTKGN